MLTEYMCFIDRVFMDPATCNPFRVVGTWTATLGSECFTISVEIVSTVTLIRVLDSSKIKTLLNYS